MFGTLLMNIGCGPNMFAGDWLNVDRDDMLPFLDEMASAVPDNAWPDWQRELAGRARRREIKFLRIDLRGGFSTFPNGSVRAIYLGQMIEHLNPIHEVPKFLRECCRMLAPGGVLRATTPNLSLLLAYHRSDGLGVFASEQPEFYRDALPEDRLAYLMFGSAGPSSTWTHYEGHQHLFTPASLRRALELAGFRDVVEKNAGESSAMSGFVDLGMSYGFAMEGTK